MRAVELPVVKLRRDRGTTMAQRLSLPNSALEVIGEEPFLLRDRLGANRGQLRRIVGEGGGGDKAGEPEEAEVHGGMKRSLIGCLSAHQARPGSDREGRGSRGVLFDKPR